MLNRKIITASAIVLFLFLFVGCKNSVTDNEGNPQILSDKTAIEQIAREDSSLLSFETNYDEEGGLDFSFGKIQTKIFPVRVVRKITNVDRVYLTDIVGDTSYVTATYSFTGNLFIAASYDSVSLGDSINVDTIIVKPFTSVITRKLIFVRVANTQNPRLNWRLIAISLPAGGTATPNIAIQKLTMLFPNDTLVITSPNDYFLSRGLGRMNQIPGIGRNQRLTIYAEIFSSYNAEDFVTLTFGADIRGLHRVKRKFILDSITPSGNGYLKVYKLTFSTLTFTGHSHAVISAIPNHVVFDDQTSVESKTWGFPYFVY